MASSFNSKRGGAAPDLRGVLLRLDRLVDWEKRSRADASGKLMRQSLAPARDLLDRVGAPDRALRCVLVAGTKGKGSVASLIAAGLRHAGRSEGVYGSPHVERIHERIRVRGGEIEDGPLASALEVVLEAHAGAQRDADGAAAWATWFDVLTTAALLAMQRAGVEWAILECGLGGRYDSTNAVHPELAVITSIELEHTQILGSTRALIAREKVGIARPGVPLVSAVGGPMDEAVQTIAAHAADVGALYRPLVGPRDATLEEVNVATANAALAVLGLGALDAATRAQARLPGRMERGRMGETAVILDGAHVPASLARVLLELEHDPELVGPPVVVFGAGSDKDTRSLLKTLVGRVDRVLCTSLESGPYAPPIRLQMEAVSLGLRAMAVADPGDALHMAHQEAGSERWVLITGSLHLIGKLRSRVRTDR